MTSVGTETPSSKPLTAKRPWALDDLPTFPLVATRLLDVLADDNAHITGVGRIIAAEPVFAGRVLQMANSPLFALQTQVKTISHAMVLLGLDRVKAIAVTRALGDFVGPVLRSRALRACWLARSSPRDWREPARSIRISPMWQVCSVTSAGWRCWSNILTLMPIS